ncbi:MAG TPA: helix-turn-helix domain-containing protein [Acidimicrobiales bacterium]|nr:helix-turn-helix domain-containing protein [Acidimicrobiales bacterium]
MQATTESSGAAQKSTPGTTGRADPSSRPRHALAGALDQVGDRWSLLVVDALADGPRRFAELQELIPGIATNVLAQRLRRLEGDRIVLAVPYSRRPLRYAYELTAAGGALAGAAQTLAQWNSDHGTSGGRTPSHELCGTPMEVRWFCPTCDRIAGAADAPDTPDTPGTPGDEIVWV